MRMPSLLASTIFVAATVMGTGAALAGPFGTGGQIKTTENSYESLVQNNGDLLNGIFNVSQINGINGITYHYGDGGSFLMGTFTGFKLVDSVSISGATRLYFSGGALDYYSNTTDLFGGTTLISGSPTLANQAAAIALVQGGTLQLSLAPELIGTPPDASAATPCANAGGCTLYIDVTGSNIVSFASAATSTVYLDITGGASAGLFDRNTLVNSFTAALADADYQGSANTTDCSIAPRWQVCGTNHAVLDVVPEPVTLSVFGAGLVGAAALRRKKAKKA